MWEDDVLISARNSSFTQLLRDTVARTYSAGVSVSYYTGILRSLNCLAGDRGCLFTFHRVAHSAQWAELPHNAFYLDTEFLSNLVQYLLRRDWAIVTMDDVADRLISGRPGKFVNFSIDDGYRDTCEVAAPIFRSLGVPFTVYLTTDIPDGAYVMWPSGLEQIIRERDQIILPTHENESITVSAVTLREKSRLYARLAKQWEADDPVAAFGRFCAANGYDAESLRTKHAISWEMIVALRDDPLVEIGAHTISHPRLSGLSASVALAELDGSRRRLEDKLGIRIRHAAFPYGRSGDCSEREFRLAEQAGYITASTTRRALLWGKRRHDFMALPRINLNGSHKSLAHVEAHLSGMSSLLAGVGGYQ